MVDKCTPDILKLPTTGQNPIWAQRLPTGRSESVQQTPQKTKRGLINLITSSSISEYKLVWLLFANKKNQSHVDERKQKLEKL